jgi:hypothetical protein
LERLISETPAASTDKSPNGFFVNQGTFNGHFQTPEGDMYDIRKLEARDVTDPRTGQVTTIWGGYAAARDLALSAKDAQLQTRFKQTGQRPHGLFAPESKDIPLYVTLRPREGKGFDHIASFWNSKGRYTILARDVQGKSGLRFGGNVLPNKSPEALTAEKEARAAVATAPDGDKAHTNAEQRVTAKPELRKPKTPA